MGKEMRRRKGRLGMQARHKMVDKEQANISIS